jgi:hypothetical protein
MMFACPNGDVFLGVIDTTKECKNAHYICNALVKYIETIGMDNIVQIYIENFSNMVNAWLRSFFLVNKNSIQIDSKFLMNDQMDMVANF